jgi:isopentenyldiphosphate isomerase
MKVPHDPDEILSVVDENDNVIGRATRREIHEKGLLHREIAVFLINSKAGVLLQLRSDNGLWDPSCSGHFPFNQSYEEAAVREFKEELGLSLSLGDFAEVSKNRLSSKSIVNNRFVKWFLVKKEVPLKKINFDRNEISSVKYFSKAQLKELVDSKQKVSSDSVLSFIKTVILKE